MEVGHGEMGVRDVVVVGAGGRMGVRDVVVVGAGAGGRVSWGVSVEVWVVDVGWVCGSCSRLTPILGE